MTKVILLHLPPADHAGGDVSINTDAAMATAHLIALEEHLAASVAVLDDENLISEICRIRCQRKTMLEAIVGSHPPGELWCASKHVLGAWMRMKEVGDKLVSMEDAQSQEAAAAMYRMAASMEGVMRTIVSSAVRHGQHEHRQCQVCIE